MIELRQASLGYGRRPVLKDINLKIERGQWVTLLGPNGAGKSTLLRGLAGVLPLQSGKRESEATQVGYIPQRMERPGDTTLTVREFLDLRPCTEGPSNREHVVGHLGIGELMEKPIRTLSGGQWQRALLAFSLWNDPEALFLDEYSEGIDIEAHESISLYIREIHRERGLTVIEVSHDLSAALKAAQRVILIKQKIVFDGAPTDPRLKESLKALYSEHEWHHL